MVVLRLDTVRAQAEDDPIAVKGAIPYEALGHNPNCTLVVTPGGGHLGWAAGPEGPLSETPFFYVIRPYLCIYSPNPET